MALVLSAEAQALLFTDARTANAFTDEPVTDAQLEAIFALSKWPPTMANTNPLHHKPELRERYVGDAAKREETARENAWLQTGYFILAARGAGLAAGSMLGFDPAGVNAELLAGTAWTSILVVNLGRPAIAGAWRERLPRLTFDEVVREA